MSENAVPVLFVGGLGRSGSTLLARMLGTIPGMVSVGELVHLWKRGPRASGSLRLWRRLRRMRVLDRGGSESLWRMGPDLDR